MKFYVLLQVGASLLGIINIIIAYVGARDRRRATPQASEPSEGDGAGNRLNGVTPI